MSFKQKPKTKQNKTHKKHQKTPQNKTQNYNRSQLTLLQIYCKINLLDI